MIRGSGHVLLASCAFAGLLFPSAVFLLQHVALTRTRAHAAGCRIKGNDAVLYYSERAHKLQQNNICTSHVLQLQGFFLYIVDVVGCDSLAEILSVKTRPDGLALEEGGELKRWWPRVGERATEREAGLNPSCQKGRVATRQRLQI